MDEEAALPRADFSLSKATTGAYHECMRLSFLAAALTFALGTPGIAGAGVPSPANSTVPCIVACPAGDAPFVVTVRDVAGNPVANSVVLVEFCLDHPNGVVQALPDFEFCCTGSSCAGPGASTPVPTGTDGRATFFLEGGGVITPSSVRVSADGIVLAYRSVTSVDLDRDFVVGSSDVALANGLVGGADPSGDFDCSGGVDSNDVAFLQQHFGHACTCPTLGRSQTWGRLKTLYR